MNRWGMPEWLEREVRERDTSCIYCGVLMAKAGDSSASRRELATWEHIINDARIVTRENIALCCAGCNASKGAKPLAVWLASPYCAQRGITAQKVAAIVKAALMVTRSAQTSGELAQ